MTIFTSFMEASTASKLSTSILKIRGALSGFGGHGWRGVFFHAGVSLVHHLRGAFLESHKTELVAIGDFDGFCEAEAIDPEGYDRLDLPDEQNGSDPLDVHGLFLLGLSGVNES